MKAYKKIITQTVSLLFAVSMIGVNLTAMPYSAEEISYNIEETVDDTGPNRLSFTPNPKFIEFLEETNREATVTQTDKGIRILVYNHSGDPTGHPIPPLKMTVPSGWQITYSVEAIDPSPQTVSEGIVNEKNFIYYVLVEKTGDAVYTENEILDWYLSTEIGSEPITTTTTITTDTAATTFTTVSVPAAITTKTTTSEATEITVPAEAEPTKYGDVNGDSSVDIADVIGLNLFLLDPEEYPLTDTQIANSDCVRDNVINSSDSALLLNCVAMIIDESKLGEPSNKIQFGICGENCTWKLDEDGLLTISGSGAMENYIDYENPWVDDSDKIKKIVVEEGITEIGRNAFCKLNEVKSIQFPSTLQIIHDNSCMNMDSLLEADIPESVVSIGNHAFSGCESLNSVNLKEGLKQIGYFAFTSPYGNALQSLYIPSTVDDIGYAAFGFMLQVNDLGAMIRPDINRTVIGYSGSEAEKYAMEFQFQFQSVDLY